MTGRIPHVHASAVFGQNRCSQIGLVGKNRRWPPTRFGQRVLERIRADVILSEAQTAHA
jgi:hypothetical protein